MSHENVSEAIHGLPDNARRPLDPGEHYVPLVTAETGVAEVTVRSVSLACCSAPSSAWPPPTWP